MRVLCKRLGKTVVRSKEPGMALAGWTDWTGDREQKAPLRVTVAAEAAGICD